MIQENRTRKLVLTALFIAIGLVLPFLTMQIPSVGNMLCPMHIPVLLCGLICGGPWGFLAGLLVPLLRSMLFGMPVLMPSAIAMSFELAAYGLVSGVLYRFMYRKKGGIYISLIGAMLSGRTVWGIVSLGLYTILGNPFTWKIFAMQAFVNAIPGIVIQLTLIPLLMYRLKETKTVRSFYGR